jgi:hypothetical protein
MRLTLYVQNASESTDVVFPFWDHYQVLMTYSAQTAPIIAVQGSVGQLKGDHHEVEAFHPASCDA